MPKINQTPNLDQVRTYFLKKKANVKECFSELRGQARIREALAEATSAAHRLQRYATWRKRFDTVATEADVPQSRSGAGANIRLLKYLGISNKPATLKRFSDAIEACLRQHTSDADRRDAMIEKGPMAFLTSKQPKNFKIKKLLSSRKKFKFKKSSEQPKNFKFKKLPSSPKKCRIKKSPARPKNFKFKKLPSNPKK